MSLLAVLVAGAALFASSHFGYGVTPLVVAVGALLVLFAVALTYDYFQQHRRRVSQLKRGVALKYPSQQPILSMQSTVLSSSHAQAQSSFVQGHNQSHAQSQAFALPIATLAPNPFARTRPVSGPFNNTFIAEPAGRLRKDLLSAPQLSLESQAKYDQLY
jgi:hypothetical protein